MTIRMDVFFVMSGDNILPETLEETIGTVLVACINHENRTCGISANA